MLLKPRGLLPLRPSGRFVAAEKLRIGETVDGILVEAVERNVLRYFLSIVQESVPGMDVRQFELLYASHDARIIRELGGEDKVRMSLGQFWELLRLGLADIKTWYIAYIPDEEGVMWAVSGHYSKQGGLRIGATFIDDSGCWAPLVDRRFLSS